MVVMVMMMVVMVMMVAVAVLALARSNLAMLFVAPLAGFFQLQGHLLLRGHHREPEWGQTLPLSLLLPRAGTTWMPPVLSVLTLPLRSASVVCVCACVNTEIYS